MGASITPVETTRSALAKLRGSSFDLIISDIDREGTSDEGTRALRALAEESPMTPVIFYIATLEHERGSPAGAFGITNRPDELIHLTLDALERLRL